MSLVMSMRFIFGHDWSVALFVHHVSLIIIYTRENDKVEIEKLKNF